MTRSHAHLDRVASPWLIRRFVDPEATFDFVDDARQVPETAMPFALSGAALGPHDATGSTFRKILRAHAIQRPELDRMAEVVEAGITVALGGQPPSDPADVRAFGSTLAMFAEAMMILRPDDAAKLRDSAPFYDALYLALWAAYGDAPALPTEITARIQLLQAAADWTSVLPAWTDQPRPAARHTQTGKRAEPACSSPTSTAD